MAGDNEQTLGDNIDLSCCLPLSSLNGLGNADPIVVLEECLLGANGVGAGILAYLQVTRSLGLEPTIRRDRV